MADSANRSVESLIMAAGKGTRMNSDLPKVLHEVAGRPMVEWVLDACDAAGATRNVVVIGHEADMVRKALAHRPNCVFVEQTEQLGTGHAVMQATDLYKDVDASVDLLVLCGDGPLIRRSTLETLLQIHRDKQAAATLATSVLDDPAGYGRIVRDAQGRFERIVEHKDASPEEREIREINPSYYCFNAKRLFETLPRISNQNAKGEYYITDVFGLLLSDGQRVEVVDAVRPEDVLSINTPEQLQQVDQTLRRRLASQTSA